MEREGPISKLVSQGPRHSPQRIPSHLPPAVRRPPATASPLEAPPLPSHGDTYAGSTRPGSEPVPHASSLNDPPPLPALCQYTRVCICACMRTPHPILPTPRPPLSPMLQQLQQEVIASIRHDILRNPGGEKSVHCRGWRSGRWPGYLGFWWAEGGGAISQLSLGDRGQGLPGTHVVVMISSLVLRISSTGPWYLQRTARGEGELRGRQGTTGHPTPALAAFSPLLLQGPQREPFTQG